MKNNSNNNNIPTRNENWKKQKIPKSILYKQIKELSTHTLRKYQEMQIVVIQARYIPHTVICRLNR